MSNKVYKSVFSIPKMDCPCEENLIRMRLQDINLIVRLDFDLAKRTLTVLHTDQVESIKSALDTLSLGSKWLTTIPSGQEVAKEEPGKQRKVLWIVLIINAAFFILEISTGMISRSMGLVADSLDMLADAFVYGMSLLAVGAALSRKKKVALFSGYIQILLAVGGVSEVIRRFIAAETIPGFQTMIGISLLALAANSICLWLLQRTKSSEIHMQASMIFSANDVIINLGIIVAGLSVWWLNSNLPDLIIGIIVFLVVIKGAIRILKLSK